MEVPGGQRQAAGWRPCPCARASDDQPLTFRSWGSLAWLVGVRQERGAEGPGPPRSSLCRPSREHSGRAPHGLRAPTRGGEEPAPQGAESPRVGLGPFASQVTVSDGQNPVGSCRPPQRGAEGLISPGSCRSQKHGPHYNFPSHRLVFALKGPCNYRCLKPTGCNGSMCREED